MQMSCCGLDCDSCEAFLAMKNNDDELRAKTAENWSKMYNHPFKAEDINCTGCMADGAKIGHCDVCDVRKCCAGKGLQNCGECADFACETIENFFKIIPENVANDNRERLIKQKDGE